MNEELKKCPFNVDYCEAIDCLQKKIDASEKALKDAHATMLSALPHFQGSAISVEDELEDSIEMAKRALALLRE